MSRGEYSLIRPQTQIYFRDIYDHLTRITEMAESFRDIVTGALDAYLSAVSNRTNEVMKILTVVATIVMPLTLIVGIYGMSLNIPEARFRYTYFVVLGIMALLTLGMLIYFRKRRWL